MPFDLKRLIRRASGNVKRQIKIPKKTVYDESIIVKQEIEIPEYIEPEQKVELPVYESDSETEITHNLPIARRKIKNENIVRKVSLNPLSDE